MSKIVDMDGVEISIGSKIRQAHLLHDICTVESVDSSGVYVRDRLGREYYVDSCILDCVWEVVE